MNKLISAAFIATLALALPHAAHGKAGIETVNAFFDAYANARQPDATSVDVERFLGFLSDDLTDHHHAYSRSFEGKTHLREGIRHKAKTMVSLSQEIETVVIGTNTIVAVVTERSKYYKDDALKGYQGRTIFVLVFDHAGLIREIRRYLD